MPVYSFNRTIPRIHRSAFVHPQAVIIGDVAVGPDCFIGPCAVLRGDVGAIEVGARTSIQDNAVIHVNENTMARIGSNCIIGHGAVLHHPTLGQYVLIGINSVVLHASVVGDSCVVAAMSVLREKSVFPAGKLIAGNPARVIKDVPEKMIDRVKQGAGRYVWLAEQYRCTMELVDGA
jgi:phenylacetic acid degradation protein